MHSKCIYKKLGSEPAEVGFSEIEIDETHIIGNFEKNLWVFGLIERYDK